MLLAAAAALTAYNRWEEAIAEQRSREVLRQLMAAPAWFENGDENWQNTENIIAAMPVQEIDDNRYVGILSLPTLELELPVMETWSYEQLRIAPCRYAGSVYTDDLLLCAHNYEAHFGRLAELSIGDPVCFTDMKGRAFLYEVDEMEILAADAATAMRSGNWDLTLFTCTLGGQQRIVVRCQKQEKLKQRLPG